MRRPDSLYVKWLMKDKNKIYEDTADLRNRLPKDFTDCEVYFVVQGPQLFVYLVYPDAREPNSAAVGPSKYRHRKVLKIYPD